MHEVTTFQYQSHQFRSIKENGDILFVAKDVCDVLCLDDVSRACDKLPDDEKLIRKIFVSGQSRDVLCVTESGLYRLIFRSNKPEAEQFRLWVFHEVLPAIRKTGTYVLPGMDMLKARELVTRESEITCRDMTVSMRVARMLGYKGRQQLLRANDLAMANLGTNFISFFNIDPEEVPEGSSPRLTVDNLELFVTEMCELGSGEVQKARLYKEYIKFCEENGGNAYVASRQHFSRRLLAIGPVRSARPRVDGKRQRIFTGICLKGGA